MQTEVHPYFQEKELKEFLAKENMVIQSWYPLGHGDKALIQEPVFSKLAKKYGKSNAQIILRWHIQAGNVVIPGSKNPEHIRANFVGEIGLPTTFTEMGITVKACSGRLPIPVISLPDAAGSFPGRKYLRF